MSHFSFPQTHVQNDVYFPHLFGAGILFGTGYVLTTGIVKRLTVQIFGDQANLFFHKYIHSPSYQNVIDTITCYGTLGSSCALAMLVFEKLFLRLAVLKKSPREAEKNPLK